MTDDLRAAVKPLKWQTLGHGFWMATAPLFGRIRVDKYGVDEKPFDVSWSVPGYTDAFVSRAFEVADDAKAAAQAHYADRILSALTDDALAALRAKMAEGE